MYGFIHESIRQLLLRNYGDEMWQQVLKRAGFESGKENIVNFYYPDSDTYLIVDSVAVLTKIPREQIWEMYGTFLVEYLMEIGWDQLLLCMSPNLKGFLENLDSLHYFLDHVVYKANLRGPSFRCEEIDDSTIILHYFTGRPGLYPIVKGVICEVARRMFKIVVSVSVTGRVQRSVQTANGERIEEHVVFHIKVIKDQGSDSRTGSITSLFQTPIIDISDQSLRMTLAEFSSALPYHVVFDEHCRLIHAGNELANHVPKELLVAGTPIVSIFKVNRPQVPFDFDNICNFINAVFVLQVKTSSKDLKRRREPVESKNDDSGSDSVSRVHSPALKLKGQMMLLSDQKSIIYICSPFVTSIMELMQYDMCLTAMPLHDSTRDLILLNQQRLTDVELNLQLEANNEQLETMAKDLEAEKRKMDLILKDMLPPSIADHLMNDEHVEAREFEHATVMFSDVPNFQSILPHCHPKDVVLMLNDLFHRFDRLVVMHKAYKVETVGDSYMTVGGIPEQTTEHAEMICHVAIGMLWEARSVVEPINKKPIQIRIGINSGSLVAGIVAVKLPRYCLFGDTVSMASALELNGVVGKIQCSDKTYKYAMQSGRFDFVRRGRIHIKGKGEVETYFLLRSTKKSVWEIVGRERDVEKNTIDGYEELESGLGFAEEQQTVIRPVVVRNSKSCSVS